MSEVIYVQYRQKPVNGIFQYWVQMSSNYDPKKEILIMKVSHDFYYPEFNTDTNRFYLALDKSKVVLNNGNGKTNISFRIFVYNYHLDKSTQVVTGNSFLYPSTAAGVTDEKKMVKENLAKANDPNKKWTTGILVTQVWGPYQRNEGAASDKLDLTQKAKYAAVLNKKGLSKAQRLSAQWRYAIDGGEKTKFTSIQESIDKDNPDRIIMEFQPIAEWAGKEVAVYAFYEGANEKVSAKVKGFVPRKEEKQNEIKEENLEDAHIYDINLSKKTVKKVKTSTTKLYIYKIYKDDVFLNKFSSYMNINNLVQFPETGPNWGRFGIRDKGGDNWIDEYVCGALLGFFYSLESSVYSGKLYYNDISANDSRNIGHQGHRKGNDIDIRYPGSTNGSQTFWYDAKKAFKDEVEFQNVLENILLVATYWGFNTNYAYKEGIKYTKGTATKVHQDHFHLGLR